MKSLSLMSTLALSLSFAGATAFAGDSVETLVNRADNANTVIVNVAGPGAENDSAVPRALLREAVCLVSIPGYKKAGFIFGGAYGAGLAACRNANGIFDTPFYVTLVGGSWGLQIGVKSTDLLLIMTEHDARSQLTGAAGIKLGVEASLAVGPLGRDVQAGTNIDFHEKTFSYSTSRGIFGGLTLNGSKLSYDNKAEAVAETSTAVTTSVLRFETMLNNLVAGL